MSTTMISTQRNFPTESENFKKLCKIVSNLQNNVKNLMSTVKKLDKKVEVFTKSKVEKLDKKGEDPEVRILLDDIECINQDIAKQYPDYCVKCQSQNENEDED